MIEFSGKRAIWESLSKNFLSCVKYKSCKNLLLISGSSVDVNKIPVQGEFENALDSDKDLEKKM